MISSRFWWH